MWCRTATIDDSISYDIYTSNGFRVRYLSGNVILTDAIKALFNNKYNQYYIKLIQQNLKVNINSGVFSGRANGPKYVADYNTMDTIFKFFMSYPYERKNHQNNPIDPNIYIPNEVLEGFIRGGRRWFAPK